MRILAILAVASQLLAADERGTLLLHFIRLPVGEETYELKTDETGSLVLHSSFGYTERGSKVALAATLRMKPDLTPVAFESKGKSYRPFSVDAAVSLHPDRHTATVREGQISREVPVPGRYFTISGYNPFSVQMMMLRYWITHGKPKRLPQLPAASPDADIAINETGRDEITIGGKNVRLTRYSVANVVWGRESIWLTQNGELAAAATFAGGLPLEAIRDEYAAALPQLLRSSDADRLHELAALTSSIQPIAQGTYAITNARLIDGKAAEPLEDAVVLIQNGKVAAAGPKAKVTLPN